MRIQIASDLHREVGEPEMFFDKTADVLCLAGDISVAGDLERALNGLNIPTNVPTLAVKGNHCFYENPNRHHFPSPNIPILQSNISILDREIRIINDQRFLVCSMWYNPLKTHGSWSDFVYYDSKLILDSHIKELAFIKENLQEGDVVMTHFLPSYSTISPRWKNSDTNCFFVGYEFQDLIIERKPKLWIHGHTHDSIDTMIGETRIVCNSFGYPGYEENPNYETKIVEI